MDEEERRRRAYILNIILIGSVVMLAILDATVLFYSLREGAADKEISFGVFSILPAFFIFLYVLSRRGRSTAASYLLVAAYLASDSYAAFRWGVTMQVVLIAYALIIVIATILLGTRSGFTVTALIAAFIIPVGYLQGHQIIQTQVQKVRDADILVFSALYFLIMIVAWLYNREIERSLRRAMDSESALKKERDLLEVRVAERSEELRQTQMEKVRQLNRLAELGQLSSGLFHDLLNLLNSLSLRIKDDSDPSLASAFGTAKQIEGFMQAVRKQIGKADSRETFSLAEGVDHAIQLVRYQAAKEHVRIVFERNDSIILYFGVPFKFQEVVINLLLNAIESYRHMSNSSRERSVTIILRESHGTVTFSVEDKGCGMTPEVQERIFEPFFTTKEASKGIGIGLATIKKIIEEELSGTITVETREDIGSAFAVIFPIEHERPPMADTQSPPAYSGTAIP